MMRAPPRSPLFPSPTLFRSRVVGIVSRAHGIIRQNEFAEVAVENGGRRLHLGGPKAGWLRIGEGEAGGRRFQRPPRRIHFEIGRGHLRTPVTVKYRMPASSF